jgi:RHS repeat-associated protein
VVTFTQDQDLAGRRVELAVDLVDGMATTHDFVNNYVYDYLGRTKLVTQQAQGSGAGYNTVAEKAVKLLYNPAGQSTALVRFSNVAATSLVSLSIYDYDGAGRLTDLDHYGEGLSLTQVADYVLGYDQANRLTSLTNSIHSGENVTAYSYDDKDQLTDVNYASATDENYDYDSGGNRESGGFTSYSGNRLASDGTFNYYYDAEGNIYKKEDALDEGNYTQYYYDQRNRMIRARFVTDFATTEDVRYTYDPFDRLVKRSTDTTSTFNHNDAVVEYFAFDGSDIALKWIDPDGTGATDPTLDRRYLNGPAIDQILAEEEDGGDTSWMVQDRQGSVTDVVNNSGSVIDHIFYDGYGNADEDTPSVKHSYGYAGYFRDEATGFYGTSIRWYNPVTGRWNGEDWIGFAGGDSNLYRYVGNQPTNAVDPSGLKPHGKLTMRLNGLAGESIWVSEAKVWWWPTFVRDLNPNYNPNDPNSQRYGPPTEGPCPCNRVELHQIADTQQKWAPWYGGTRVKRWPWHYDAIRKGADVVDWVRGAGVANEVPGVIATGGDYASLRDTPGDDLGLIYLWQEFETCAICTDQKSTHYQEVFGCAQWSHDTDGTKKTYKIAIGSTKQEKTVTQPNNQNPQPGVAISTRTIGSAPTADFLKHVGAELKYKPGLFTPITVLA